MTTANYADVEMSLAQMAEKWGVGEKTIENWTEFVYQAFGHSIPKRGAFYYVDTFLLDLVREESSSPLTCCQLVPIDLQAVSKMFQL
jgi:hypothetical protein